MTAITASQQPIFAVDTPKRALSLQEAAREVLKRHRKTPAEQMFEAIKLQIGRGKVSMGEYYAMRLFDDEQLAGADKSEFMGIDRIRKFLTGLSRASHWSGAIVDKIAFATLLDGLGYPVGRLKAVFGNARLRGRQAGLEDRAALHRFLADPLNYPMFGKPVSSSLSRGAESFASVEGETIITTDGRHLPIADVVRTIDEHFAEDGYLFQEHLSPHPEIAAICGNRLATVRVVTVTTDHTEILGTAWKIPAGANTADNFWRPGNILATVDLSTGRVLRAIQGTGLDQREIENHPDTDAPIVGTTVPCWEDAIESAKACAEMFKCPVVGWDVAITERGACLLEANVVCDLRLLQFAERRGAYDARLQAVAPFLKQRSRANLRSRRQKNSAAFKELLALAADQKVQG